MLNADPFLADIGIACICHCDSTCFTVSSENRFLHICDGASVNDDISMECGAAELANEFSSIVRFEIFHCKGTGFIDLKNFI